MATFNPFDPTAAFLMGAGANMLQAGGWSPQPVGLGQALGAGLRGGQQSYLQALQQQRMAQQQRIEEGLQKAREARMAAQQRYIAQLSPEEQTRAQAMGVPEYMAASMTAPKAPQTRKLSLPGGMVQEQELTAEGWSDVGSPYSRRDPLYQVQGIDDQGRPIVEVLSRPAVEAQVAGPSSEELRRVTVATGERKKPTQQQVMLEANTKSALQDIETAKNILFTPEGQLNREATGTGMLGIPGSEGRTGYQALRRAVEVLLRARTGAAAPAQEVDTYMSLYAPSPLDSDEAAQNKIQQLENIFGQTMETFSAGDFDWQGGDTPSDLPAPTVEAGTAPSGIEGMSDAQVLTIPPGSIAEMSQEDRDALDARLKAMGF